jgi:hypothetical protein
MFHRSSSIGLFILSLSLGSIAQTLEYSPLGAAVKPGEHPHLPTSLQSQLPKDAVPQLDAKTHMNVSGEEVVVYSLEEHDMDSHIAVFREGKLSNDFSLTALSNPKDPVEIDDRYVFFSFLEVPTQTSSAVVFSFHNYGDGAGTVLVVIAPSGEMYKVAFSFGGQQTQLKYSAKTYTAELWDASGEGGCVWCEQPYDVSRLQWKYGKLVTVSKFRARHKLAPSPMSDRPILLIKPPSPHVFSVQH